MFPHPLTSFEINKYSLSEHGFDGGFDNVT